MQVVLVHGIWDSGRVYRPMADALTEAGHHCFAPDLLPANGRLGLVDLAEKLKSSIDREFGPEAPFALIAHSMGSIVARYYLQKLGGTRRANRFFTISGPHRGTWSALIWPGKAARDMRPRSPLLQELNADPSALLALRPQSYRTPFDLLIVPSRSSQVEWAENHVVPVLLHHWMLRHPEVIDHITKSLDEPVDSRRARADCSSPPADPC